MSMNETSSFRRVRKDEELVLHEGKERPFHKNEFEELHKHMYELHTLM